MTLETKRPWGKFVTFALNEKCTVKLLMVKPNEKLSLQKHKHREERWYFIDDGYIQIENKIKKIKANKEIIIKKNQAHRLIAKEKKVRVLEVSFGKFDENDEIRLEDKYDRR